MTEGEKYCHVHKILCKYYTQEFKDNEAEHNNIKKEIREIRNSMMPKFFFTMLTSIVFGFVGISAAWVGYELHTHNSRLINLQVNQAILLKSQGVKPIENDQIKKLIQEEKIN